MATIESIDLISSDPQVRSGRPCVAGTQVEVSAIVIEHIVHQRSLGEIAADYSLSLAQVDAALAYYYMHKSALDDLMHEQSRRAKELREQRVGSRHSPLPG